jgi:hypothetical protein
MIAVLQAFGTGLTLLFGVLAVLAWRRLGPDRWRKTQAGWFLTGACFVMVGFVGTVHAFAASLALRAGSGSPVYRMFIEWSPAGNVGREAAVVAYAVMLAVLVAAPPHRAWQVAAAGPWVIGLVTVGATAVAAQAAFMSVHRMMSVLAVLSTVSVVVMLVALLVGVVNDGMDVLLWLAVAAYTLKQTLGVSLMAMLAWWELDGGIDAALLFMWINIVAMAIASALARVRLRRALQNRHVPALFERLHALRRPVES